MSGSTNASLPARLLAFSAQWEREGNAPETVAILREAAAALSVPVPEGDMARALEWVREVAKYPGNRPTEILAAIEEAIAAYDPERAGARSGKVTTLQPGDGWRPIAEAWKAFAEHQVHCAECAESVESCADGRELRDAAIAQEAERGAASAATRCYAALR